MINREKLISRVALKCADMVRQLSYHRAIHLQKNQFKFKLNFWIYMYNNAIDMAVLDWVHLFGNDKDDLHWKNIVQDIETFRADLFSALDVNREIWEGNWRKIKEYRNKDVAHIEIRPISYIPEMDLALKATCFYYSHIICELEKLGNYTRWPKDLLSYYEKSLQQSKGIADKALDATSAFNEGVY